MPAEGRFEGQGWIVTGGTRGIGRAIALAAEAEGAKVVVSGRKRPPADSPGITFVEGDVANEADVERLFDRALETFETLHVVVNNAGVSGGALLVDTTLEQWNAILATNLQGPFLVSRRAVEEFMAQGEGGRIVNLGSFAEGGMFGEAAYAASKSGLAAMTRSIAREFGKKRITCNLVAPGYISTEMTAGIDAAGREARAALSSPSRFGTAEEVAQAVLFFASDEAAFVTGESLYVAGAARDVPASAIRARKEPHG